MRHYFFGTIAALSLTHAIDNDLKGQIADLIIQRDSTQFQQNRSETDLQLAKTRFFDQDQEGAFRDFLEALETAPPNKRAPLPEEVSSYEKALELYLSAHGSNVPLISRQIIETYAPIVQSQPSGNLTGFILAAAYANLGDFPKYFDLMYVTTRTNPEHYFVHKGKAILHLKLFERACPGEEKEKHRAALQNELDIAAQKFPADTSLYRLMIIYASDSDKQRIVSSSLNRIIDNDILVPRGDLEFYFQNAFSNANLDLTEKFVSNAKKKYEYSRVIAKAQQRIEQLKEEKND